MWTVDFWMGATWTLLCLLTGGLIVFFLVCVLGDRPIPGYPKDPPDDPGPETVSPYGRPDELFVPVYSDDGKLVSAQPVTEWLAENRITEPFEANLLPRSTGDASVC